MEQILLNSLVSASAYILVALGFSLIYMTTRFFHFAHGIVLTTGAYAVFVFKVWLRLPLGISILGGILFSSLLGVLLERRIYLPFRKKLASPSILLFVSLGIYVAVQGLITLVFGAGTKTFRTAEVPIAFAFTGARLTWVQVLMVAASVAGWMSVWLALQRTLIGKQIRAVASDPDLAEVYGLNRDKIVLVAFTLGSATAGLAGVLLAFDSDMTPTMGFRVLAMAMVVMIVGGVGSIRGIALGAILLAGAQQLTAWWISSMWQDAIAFVILILF